MVPTTEAKEQLLEIKARMVENENATKPEVSKKPRRRKSRYEQDKFNKTQNFLYKRALFGLNLYSREELKGMHWEKKRRIKRVQKRAQGLINIWKQQEANTITNMFLITCFPKSPIVKALVSEPFKDLVDVDFRNNLELRDLGITKDIIVERFIAEGVLPKEFYDPKNVQSKPVL